MFTGPSIMDNSMQKVSQEVNIVGVREHSGFTLKRDSSEEIQLSSNVLLSRVASKELHAETMRLNIENSSQYKPEISADDQFDLRKKALSMESARQDLITNAHYLNN